MSKKSTGNEESQNNDSSPSSGALQKLADLLATRSHSEHELRTKLLRHFDASAVDEALSIAKAKNWIESDSDLGERVSKTLAAKGKGHAYIAEYLETKGLMAPSRDSEGEIQKARELIKSKLAKVGGIDYDMSVEQKRKLFRFLAGRGFDEDTILQALHLDGLDFSDSADGC